MAAGAAILLAFEEEDDKEMEETEGDAVAAAVKEELVPAMLPPRWWKALGADSKWCLRCRREGSGEVSPAPTPPSAPSGWVGEEAAEWEDVEGDA